MLKLERMLLWFGLPMISLFPEPSNLEQAHLKVASLWAPKLVVSDIAMRETYHSHLLNSSKQHYLLLTDCVQVSFVEGKEELACYFNFNVDNGEKQRGRIMAEALFDLENFPAAELVITGGSGDFEGIVGSGKTEAIEGETRDTFIYNFEYTKTETTWF